MIWEFLGGWWPLVGWWLLLAIISVAMCDGHYSTQGERLGFFRGFTLVIIAPVFMALFVLVAVYDLVRGFFAGEFD